MKKQVLLIFFFLTVITPGLAQHISRVLVSGKIVVVDTEDVEGITVFNKTTKIGTVTDENGAFKMEVGLLDEIEFSALQFEVINVKIDEDVLESKQLTVFLIEHVNRLNEVVLFPYGLTGSLTKDLNKIKTFSTDLSSVQDASEDITAYKFSDDYHSKVDNTILREGQYYNGADLVKITNWLFKPMLGKKGSHDQEIIEETDRSLGLRGVYSYTFITEHFGVPGPRVDEFLDYLDQQEIDPKLLEPGNEILLIEFLSKSSKTFLSK